ncbi:MAG TPA: hypothetical protein VJT10_00485, partial [Steroidobacteraceae bacterium]|nr:hypothetical protein [Steroidobacteraceae bacterium]
MLNPKSTLESLLAPGLRLMQAVRLPVKFTIVAAALLVPLCVAVYGVVDYAESNIAFGMEERLGVAYVAPLTALLQEATQSPEAGATRTFAALERLTASQGDALQVAAAIGALRARPAASQILALFTQVSDNSKLTLDPDLDSYYVMALVMDHAPKLAVAAAELDAGRASMLHDSLAAAVKRASAANPALASDLSTAELESAYARFSSTGGASRGDGLALSRATLALTARSANALDRLLVKRIDGFESHRNRLLGLTLLSLLLAVYLISGFYLSNLR